MAVGDIIFNVSEMAERCLSLYGMTTTAHILSDRFAALLAPHKKNQGYVMYRHIERSVNEYFNLAIARVKSEEYLIHAETAAPWFIEWLFTKILYKKEDAERNIDQVNRIRMKYLTQSLG